MEITYLKNGQIQATARMGWQQVRREEADFYRCSGSMNARDDLYETLVYREFPTVYDPAEGYRRKIHVGDEGCLRLISDVSPNALRSGRSDDYELTLYADERGIPGNMKNYIFRMHGWRGTSNDNHVSAGGWRRVESVERLSRGVGFRVIFSADMRRD